MSPAQLLGISPQTVALSIFLVEEALDQPAAKDFHAELIRTRQELAHLHRLISPLGDRLAAIGTPYTPCRGQGQQRRPVEEW